MQGNGRLRTLTGVALATGFAAAVLPGTAVRAQQQIVVGATVPITGPLSLSGRQYYDSLQMAQDDINKAGGIGGKNLQIVFEDTQASNSVAVNAFVKVVQEKKPPFVFLNSYSTQNLATAPEVARAKIPVMYAGGADAVAKLDNPWMFRIRPYDGAAAIAMAQFITKELKKTKPGILYIQNDFGQGAADVATRKFEELGVKVVGVQAYGESDKDMSAQILNLKNQGADVLLAMVYPTDGALLMTQIKQLGVDLPFVGSSGGFLPAALNLVSAAELKNVWGVVDACLDPSKGPKVKDFVERYQKRFGRAADPYAASYYDGAIMLADALRKVGTDPVALRDYIANIKGYQGVAHTYSFDKQRNGVHDVAVIKFEPGTKNMQCVDEIVVE